MTREQFVSCVEGTQKAFRRFLTALCCGDAATADDVAQEAYLKAYMSVDSLRDASKFQPWLYRIGYTTFLNMKRSARPTDGYEEARSVAASDVADSSFRYQALYMALDRLTPAERSSVLLFYMYGYSTREIAEIESTSEAAVRQHLSRGRNHLRTLLNNE